MYVGITRAQRSLHVTYCEKRPQGREWSASEPSRFINEMGKEDLRFSGGTQVLTAAHWNVFVCQMLARLLPLKQLLTTPSSSVTSRYPSPDYFPVTGRVSCCKAGKKPTGKYNQTKRQGDSKC
jgi:hypothetical protein